jgi:hypothetical protein
MKKLLFVLLLLPVFTFSQTTTWTLLINTNDDNKVTDVIEGSMGNLYITGYSKMVDDIKTSGFVTKLDKTGMNIDSMFIIKSDTSTIITKIISDTSPTFTIVSEMNDPSTNHKHCSFSLQRIDTNLNITLSKSYSFPPDYNNQNVNISYGINNNIIVFGHIFPYGIPKVFLYETSINFDSIQAKIFLDGGAAFPQQIHQLNNYGYWLIHGLHSTYIYIDSSLNLVSMGYGEMPKNMPGMSTAKWDSDSSFYFAGDYVMGMNRSTDHDIGFFHQYDPFDSSNAIFNYWGSKDTIDLPSFYGALDFKNKDSIFIAGSKNLQYGNVSFGTTPSWYVLLQTDSMLNIRWERFYGGDACYNMTKLIATNDGGCIMAGTRFDFKAHPWVHERDIYILKVNAEGLITSANGQIAPTVHDAIVYPNPGSNHLKIRIGVQHKQSTFKLFDMTGRQVLEKHIEGCKAEINTQFLKSGTYVYTLKNNSGLNETGKWVKQ